MLEKILTKINNFLFYYFRLDMLDMEKQHKYDDFRLMNKQELNPVKPKYQAMDEVVAQQKDKTQWENFAIHCGKNVFMREHIIEHQKGLCKMCGVQDNINPEYKFHIHHVDYQHFCAYKSKKPNCEYCFNTSPNLFRQCAKRLKALHPRCHREVHEDLIEEREKKKMGNNRGNGSQRKFRNDSIRREVMEWDRTIFEGCTRRVPEEPEKAKELYARIEEKGYVFVRSDKEGFTIADDKGVKALFFWTDGYGLSYNNDAGYTQWREEQEKRELIERVKYIERKLGQHIVMTNKRERRYQWICFIVLLLMAGMMIKGA